MTYYSSYYVLSPYDLEHHGILGMKWGVRRYQNKDGTLTEAGKKRYGSVEGMNAEKDLRKTLRNRKVSGEDKINAGQKALSVLGKEKVDQIMRSEEMRKKTLSALKGAAISAGSILVGSMVGQVISSPNNPLFNDQNFVWNNKLGYGERRAFDVSDPVQKALGAARKLLKTGEYAPGAKEAYLKDARKAITEKIRDQYEEELANTMSMHPEFNYNDQRNAIFKYLEDDVNKAVDQLEFEYDSSMDFQNDFLKK